MISLITASFRVLDRRTRRGLILALPASIAMGLVEGLGFSLVFPFIRLLAAPDGLEADGVLGRLYEKSGIEDPKAFIQIIGAALFITLLLRSLCGILYLRWQTKLLAKGEATVAVRLFRLYLRADYALHLRRHSAELIRNIQQSVTTMFGRLLFPLVQLLAESFLIVAILVTLIVIDPLAAAASAAVLGVTAATYVKVFGHRARQLGSDDMRLLGKNQQQLQEGIGGVKILQAFGRVDSIDRAFERSRFELARVRYKQLYASQLPRYLLEAALVIALAMVIVLIMVTRSGPDAIATLGLLSAGSFRLMPSLQRVLSASNYLEAGRAAAEIVVTEMQSPPGAVGEVVAVAGARLEFRSELKFESVSYTYPGTDERVLRDVNLLVKRGEALGLVGPSGSGKTTIVDLLLGLLTPSSGRILVDGVPLDVGQIPAWRRLVGYVPQEVFLFDDSLRRNIALGLPDEEIDRARLSRAVELAQLDEFVADLPEGMETRMGEQGVRLSGGQRQRVGIARALYAEPEVLVLDEATSSLDSVTAASIVRTVNGLRGELTIVVVAHQLSTVQHCDSIVFVAEGCVEGVGTFSELAAGHAQFARLVQMARGISNAGSDGTIDM